MSDLFENQNEEVVETEEKDANDLRREAYSAATTALRKMHRKDFDDILEVAYAERGLVYQRKLTDEEKAIKKIREITEGLGLHLTDEMITAMLAQDNKEDADSDS